MSRNKARESELGNLLASPIPRGEDELIAFMNMMIELDLLRIVEKGCWN